MSEMGSQNSKVGGVRKKGLCRVSVLYFKMCPKGVFNNSWQIISLCLCISKTFAICLSMQAALANACVLLKFGDVLLKTQPTELSCSGTSIEVRFDSYRSRIWNTYVSPREFLIVFGSMSALVTMVMVVRVLLLVPTQKSSQFSS